MLIRCFCAACEVGAVTFYLTFDPAEPELIAHVEEIGRACDCREPETYYLTIFRAINFADFVSGRSDELPEARDYPAGFYPPERKAA
jgi:hypothetical protein